MKPDLKYLQLFENRLSSLRRLADLGLIDMPDKIRDYLAGPMTGDLDLIGADLRELPAGLRVGGNLWLSYSSVESLPPGLRVGGDLWLNRTPIKELPPDLQVGGNIIGFEG